MPAVGETPRYMAAARGALDERVRENRSGRSQTGAANWSSSARFPDASGETTLRIEQMAFWSVVCRATIRQPTKALLKPHVAESFKPLPRFSSWTIALEASKSFRSCLAMDSRRLQRFTFTLASQQPQIRPHSHGAESNVDVGETDREQTHPCPHHVAPVEAAHALITLEAERCVGRLIEESADQMTQ